MKKALNILLVAFMITFSLSACKCNAYTPINTNAYVPDGTVCYEWNNYKIYSSYEYTNNSETNNSENGITNDTGTVSNMTEDKMSLGLFDCTTEKPRFIADVPSLDQFSISEKYNSFYTWEIEQSQDQKSTDIDGYSMRKYNYTLNCYFLSLSNAEEDKFNQVPIKYSKTIHGIDKITDRLWWNDTTIYVRTERQYLGKNTPNNPSYQSAYAISVTNKDSSCTFKEISETDIPYDITNIDFDFVEQKIRSNSTAQNDIIGTMGFADCEITANGNLRKLDIPLYIYKGRKDYNDYWYLSNASIRCTPLGLIVLSEDYVDEEKPFYESRYYEEYRVHKMDPLKNWGLNDLSKTLNSIKQLCKQMNDILVYTKKQPLFYNLFFNRFPPDNISYGNNGIGRIDKYNESIENGTMQSLRLSANGVHKVETFQADTGLYQFFILLPQYTKDTINTNELYLHDTAYYQLTDSAYPIQIEICTEK